MGEPIFETLADLAGGPRQEHAVVALDGEVYVIGGFTGSGMLTDTVEAYNPETNTWRNVASFPTPLHHANAATVGGKIYVLGFLLDAAFTPTGDALVYDPMTDAWTDVTAMPAGTGRGAAGVAVVGTEIFVFGGSRSGTVADASAFDTASETWRTLPSMPAPREHMAATTIDGIVYVGGGRANGITGFTDVVLSFDPQRESWSTLAPIPTARGGVAGSALAGRFFVFGGEGNPDDASGVFDDTEAYDPTNDTWEVLLPMEVPRHGLGAATVGDRIYLPGGATHQSFGPVATCTAFGFR
jgi:N-acetylneuraminic acid mutarotase